MFAWFKNRRIVLFLVALVCAIVTLKSLSLGLYCSVPSAIQDAGNVDTAETSIYGVVLYRETGTERMRMYHQAVWWYEATLFGIWGTAVVVGTGVYLVGRLCWYEPRT